VIASWMAYSVALGVLLGLVAVALELAGRMAGKPARFLWAATVAASLLVPSTAVVARRAPAPLRAPVTPQATTIGPAARPAPAAPATEPAAALVGRMTTGLAALDAPLLLLWGAASLLLGLGVIRAAVALRRRARGWSATALEGSPVLVAPDVGPAVVRLRGLQVVLPAWALEAEPDARSLMLRHEREHCAARDPDLLLGATLALVLMPWNPALWWQVRRLQLAVETDCDRRVMRAGADAHAYGTLLLSVGARRVWRPLLATSSFAETPSLLRRRIEAMIAPRPRHPAVRAALAAAVALLAVALAGMVPRPAPVLRASPRPGGLATRLQGPCTDTMGIQLTVTREAGAVTVTDEDLASVPRILAAELGYAPALGPAAAHAPVRLEIALTLKPGYAEARTTVTRAGIAGGMYSSNEGTLPTEAGAATVGSIYGTAIQTALRHLPRGNCGFAGPAAMRVLNTSATREAVRRHAAAINALARPQDAGVWLVQDSTGAYISSGVLESFPESIGSRNYKTVVPGAAATGQDARSFGFARSPVVDGAGPFRLVYVTVDRRP